MANLFVGRGTPPAYLILPFDLPIYLFTDEIYLKGYFFFFLFFFLHKGGWQQTSATLKASRRWLTGSNVQWQLSLYAPIKQHDITFCFYLHAPVCLWILLKPVFNFGNPHLELLCHSSQAPPSADNKRHNELIQHLFYDHASFRCFRLFKHLYWREDLQKMLSWKCKNVNVQMELNAFVRIITISLFDRITQPENKVTKGTSFKTVTKIVTRLPYKIVQFCK